MDTFSDEQLANMAIGSFEDGITYAVDLRTIEDEKQLGTELFKTADLSACALNLLIAAPVMYRSLIQQYSIIEGIVGAIDHFQAYALNTHGEKLPLLEKLQDSLIQMQTLILNTKQVATEGLEKVSDEILKNLY